MLIFDLGGGTFDITIASVKGKKVDVITSVGDKELGGQDFDREILNVMGIIDPLKNLRQILRARKQILDFLISMLKIIFLKYLIHMAKSIIQN